MPLLRLRLRDYGRLGACLVCRQRLFGLGGPLGCAAGPIPQPPDVPRSRRMQDGQNAQAEKGAEAREGTKCRNYLRHGCGERLKVDAEFGGVATAIAGEFDHALGEIRLVARP